MGELNSVDGELLLINKENSSDQKNIYPKTFSKNVYTQDDKSKNLNDKLSEIDTSLNQLPYLEEAINGAITDLQTSLSQLETAKTNITILQTTVGNMSTNLSVLQSNITSLSSLASSVSTNTSNINSLTSTVSEHTSSISTINNQVSTINNQVSTINNQILTINNTLNNIGSDTGTIITNSRIIPGTKPDSFINSTSDTRVGKWVDLTTFTLPKGTYLFTTEEMTATLLITGSSGTQSATIEFEVSNMAINDTSSGKYNNDHPSYNTYGWTKYPFSELHGSLSLVPEEATPPFGNAMTDHTNIIGIIRNLGNSSETWYIRYHISYTGSSTLNLYNIYNSVFKVVKLSDNT